MTVNVQFQADDFCETIESLNCYPYPANVKPVMLVAQKGRGEVLRYPKALLKQFCNVENSPDMTLVFNPNVNWQFGGGSSAKTSDSSPMYDFELWAARQMARGLGIYSGMVYRKSARDGISYLSPEITTVTDPKNPVHNITFFQNWNVFESFLMKRQKSVLEHLPTFSKVPKLSNVDAAQFLGRFEDDDELSKKLIQKSSALLNSFKNYDAQSQWQSNTDYRWKLIPYKINSVVDFQSKVPAGRLPLEYLLSEAMAAPSKSLVNNMKELDVNEIFGANTLILFKFIGYNTSDQFKIIDYPWNEIKAPNLANLNGKASEINSMDITDNQQPNAFASDPTHDVQIESSAQGKSKTSPTSATQSISLTGGSKKTRRQRTYESQPLSLPKAKREKTTNINEEGRQAAGILMNLKNSQEML